MRELIDDRHTKTLKLCRAQADLVVNTLLAIVFTVGSFAGGIMIEIFHIETKLSIGNDFSGLFPDSSHAPYYIIQLCAVTFTMLGLLFFSRALYSTVVRERFLAPQKALEQLGILIEKLKAKTGDGF